MVSCLLHTHARVRRRARVSGVRSNLLMRTSDTSTIEAPKYCAHFIVLVAIDQIRYHLLSLNPHSTHNTLCSVALQPWDGCMERILGIQSGFLDKLSPCRCGRIPLAVCNTHLSIRLFCSAVLVFFAHFCCCFLIVRNPGLP